MYFSEEGLSPYAPNNHSSDICILQSGILKELYRQYQQRLKQFRVSHIHKQYKQYDYKLYKFFK